jgi:hypothetical protein
MHRPIGAYRFDVMFSGSFMAKRDDEQYGEQETQQRFEKLVHVALKTPPKPQKMMERKGVAAQAKKARRKSKSAA